MIFWDTLYFMCRNYVKKERKRKNMKYVFKNIKSFETVDVKFVENFIQLLLLDEKLMYIICM